MSIDPNKDFNDLIKLYLDGKYSDIKKWFEKNKESEVKDEHNKLKTIIK
jgi:predicted adenine nucleotide alpha hydrolase (AANH) superfamily ATPase